MSSTGSSGDCESGIIKLPVVISSYRRCQGYRVAVKINRNSSIGVKTITAESDLVAGCSGGIIKVNDRG